MDISSIINFTEASAENILVVSLLVIMAAYVLNVLFTATSKGIGLTSDKSDIDPTTLPCVPEEVAEAIEDESDVAVEGEGSEDKLSQGDETKED
jgi:hypothetical protein